MLTRTTEVLTLTPPRRYARLAWAAVGAGETAKAARMLSKLQALRLKEFDTQVRA